jgi:hypothetical protein
MLKAMEDDVVPFSDDPADLDVLAGILARGLLKVVDKSSFSVPHSGVVLNVLGADVSLDGLSRFASVEHQLIKLDDIALIPFQGFFHSGHPSSGNPSNARFG